MKLGALTTEIKAASLSELFRKTRDYGFSQVQFDYTSAGIAQMPDHIPDSLKREIAEEAGRNGIDITAISGTFNMAHPDSAVRREGAARFETIAASCAELKCDLVTVCTGSRNRDNMWAPHPDNNTAEAWKDMIGVMEQLIVTADKYNIHLGIETEASNVINTPEKAKKLIEDMKSPRLNIIMDAANLFREGMARRENARNVISGAIELLGPWIVIAHGKDIKEGDGIEFTSAGRGIIDFDFFLRELEKAGYKGGMILHGIKNEGDIPESVNHVRKAAEAFHSFN